MYKLNILDYLVYEEKEAKKIVAQGYAQCLQGFGDVILHSLHGDAKLGCNDAVGLPPEPAAYQYFAGLRREFLQGMANQVLHFVRQQLLRIACLQCGYFQLELPLLQRLQATLGLLFYGLPFQLVDAFMPHHRKQIGGQVPVYNRIPVLPIVHEAIVHNVLCRFVRRHVRAGKTDKAVEVGCVNPVETQ